MFIKTLKITVSHYKTQLNPFRRYPQNSCLASHSLIILTRPPSFSLTHHTYRGHRINILNSISSLFFAIGFWFLLIYEGRVFSKKFKIPNSYFRKLSNLPFIPIDFLSKIHMIFFLIP